uniref:EB domain-containing protein n=1 Tax=Romanomermis culicivorax TaxID=13658 RepID=A0A915KB35_ROMCU
MPCWSRADEMKSTTPPYNLLAGIGGPFVRGGGDAPNVSATEMYRVGFGGFCNFTENCRAAYSICMQNKCTCRSGFVEMAERGICGMINFYCPDLTGKMPTAANNGKTCLRAPKPNASATGCSDDEFCCIHTHRITSSKYYVGHCCKKPNQTSTISFPVCPLTMPSERSCLACQYNETCMDSLNFPNTP